MLHRCILAVLLLCTLGRATVVDRIAIIVGKRAIKISDIERELRISSFLNRQPLDESLAAKRKAAERLIDQELMRQELLAGQYSQPTDADASGFLQQLKRDRFHGSDAEFQAELSRHRLTQEQLQRELLWQLTVLRFIDERFRPGVLVTDEDVASYHRQHLADLQKAYPRNHSLEALSPRIRETLTGERVNQAFEDWLSEMRHGTRIDYREQAFAGGNTK